MDMNTSDIRENRTQRPHPAFPSFLAHPRHCRYEVEARPEQVPSEYPRTSHQRNGRYKSLIGCPQVKGQTTRRFLALRYDRLETVSELPGSRTSHAPDQDFQWP